MVRYRGIRRGRVWAAGWLSGGAVAAFVALCAPSLLGQTPAAPETAATIVDLRYTRLMTTISYDLPTADPSALYNVYVVVIDNGQTIRVQGVTGDVGPKVPAGLPGTHKSILWRAGQDFETPPALDSLEYHVIAAPAVGGLKIETNPPGATVKIDDETTPRPGVTPLEINNLRTGSHRITVAHDGYLENSHYEVVDAAATKTVVQTLTPIAAPAGGGTTGGGPVAPPKRGLPKWLLPAAGAGGGVAVLALAKGKKAAPTPVETCTFSISPTSATFPASGGSTSVTVTASSTGCTWTAVGGDLSNGATTTGTIVVSPTSASGTQTIVVTVPANNSTGASSGTATIAESIFTVSESALPNENKQIQGNSATFQTFSVQAVANTKLTITAIGCINTTSNGCVGPQGIGVNAGAQGRLPGAPSFGLVCGIGGQLTSDLFYAGPGSAYATGITVSRSGTIFCGLNAPDAGSYAGNTGTWSVTVVIGG